VSLRNIIGQLVLAITLLAACSPLTDTATTPELTPVTAAPTPTSSPPAGVTPADSGGETGVPDPAPTPDQAAHPLAGLVYRTVDGVWIVERNGESTWLVDSPYAAVSPDGDLVAYAYGDPEDIYLMDRKTGETSNLTNTPDRVERWPKFWAARPELLAFSSASLDESMFGGGHPTLVNMDGSNYQVLDPTGGGEFSLSPDGDHIAFGCCSPTATLYSLSSGPSVFDPSEFGQPVEAMFLPSFAPDNQQLAWAVNSGSLLGVSLFDLALGSSTFLHPYQPVGGSEFYGELAWSPSSEWLVYVNTNELTDMGRRPTLWALQPGTGDEIFLGEGYRPAWKPDGTQLAYTTSGAEGTDWTIWLVDPQTWMNPEPAPFKGEVFGWVTP
jgi:WD40 repeat protein